MPWSPEDAERHTHKAATRELQELWAKVANEALERTGDEGRAIREANAVVGRQEAREVGARGRAASLTAQREQSSTATCPVST